jgi:uroporphyrinogen decarboxylase
VGLTNLLGLLVEKPDLVDYLSRKVFEQAIESIRRLAAAGGDAIFIDDALSTCDMISVKHYERFSLPHVTEMVREIHRLQHKAIVIYFGGVADRLDQIASTGADALAMEASMKGYVNDISGAAEKIGQRISLFGNVDPVGVLQDGTDAELEDEVRRQALAGKKARGFVMSTGSPITPATPLWRVRRFIELGRMEY